MKKILLPIILFILCLALTAQNTSWPMIKTEMKPASRWWWMGSAVDKDNLRINIAEYAKKGIGGLEITPIYGVQGNEDNEIQYLSPKWMEMYKYTLSEAGESKMNIDLNNGTGWPFGGPLVTLADAATNVIFEKYQLDGGKQLIEYIVTKDEKQSSVATLSKLMAYSDKGEVLDLTVKVKDRKLQWTAPKGKWLLIAVFNGKTFQKVKRAAPGGEGYVLNHFSEKAVKKYLDQYTDVFINNKASFPNSFFNDSYEVYGADWTPDMFDQFEKRRGYKLENYLPEFLSTDRNEKTSRIISDYRETLNDLLLENFTLQWTSWAHKHGSTTRNQAHGSPANLIDIYAAVDIPECESFGISDFKIKGLRTDTIKKINDSDLSMLKYASSAAHITGKPYVSSETLTWLTEHFRTSLSQCKPDLDLLFCSGVNHVYFHGTTYSPKEAAWPGWKFYASIDMSPTNSIWHDSQALFQYITRCQSFLQEGKPDNDFLLYFPVYDMWQNQNGRLLMFDIHKMQQRTPEFIATVNSIIQSGFDVDYISDKYLQTTAFRNGKLETEGGSSYKAIIVPATEYMPLRTLKQLLHLAKNGATVIFVGGFPKSVPGFYKVEDQSKEFAQLLKPLLLSKGNNTKYGKGAILVFDDLLEAINECHFSPEQMKTKYNVHAIRRSNDDGYHYFLSVLHDQDINDWVTLAVDAENVMLFNPLDGTKGLAKTRKSNGKTQVYLQLSSGQSLIIKTFNKELTSIPDWKYYKSKNKSITINNNWHLKFLESTPIIDDEYMMDTLQPWTELKGTENLRKNMGSALYTTTVHLEDVDEDNWLLDLGDVRESARVRVNGKEAGILWSVPFTDNIGQYLKKGENLIEIEVTNLPANRIADYDRNKVNWRIFNEINFVKQDYKKGDYSNWDIMPSGLLGPVTLTPLSIIK